MNQSIVSRYKQTLTLATTILLFVLLAVGCQQTEQDIPGLPFYNTADFTPRWIEAGSDEYESIHKISPFSFKNQNGNTVTEAAFENKIYVADFIFTRCPSICPPMTSNMLYLQEQYLDDPDIMFISHSVTPEADSVSVLRQYADGYGILDDKWHVVTGDRTEIYTLARKSYFADKELGIKKGPDDFLHTDNFILVDSQRRIRGVYSGADRNDMQRLMEDIALLKKHG